MIRTQIYIEKELKSDIENLAKAHGISMGEMIRTILARASHNKHQFTPFGNDLPKLADLKITGGPKNLSSRMDEYLYGE